MVALKEVEDIGQNMFWGIALDSGKQYTQTVETSFHISCAALEVGVAADGPQQRVAVMLQHEKVEFLLCTLDNMTNYQQALDLNFTEGEEVSFFLNGQGVVHLTGYLVPEDTNDEFGSCGADIATSEEDDSDEGDDSDKEIPRLQEISEHLGKRKRAVKEASSKKKRKNEKETEEPDDLENSDNDEDSDEDPEFSAMHLDMQSDSDDDDSLDVSDDSEDDDDSDEDDSDEDDSDGDDSDGDDKDNDENDEPLPSDLSGSFLQEKSQNKKIKTPQKEVVVASPKVKKTPKVEKTAHVEAKSPHAGRTPNSEKKGKQEKNEKMQNTPNPKGKKRADKTATPNTDGKKKKRQQAGQASPDTPGKNIPTSTTGGKKKKKKQQQEAHANPDTVCQPTGNGTATTPNTEGKKKKQKGQQNKAPAEHPKKAKKLVLAGGTTVEELKEGHGQEAKSGKMVHVYYKGTLSNGSVFDACTSGKPFNFKLGKREVIPGWDTGIQGMKVGTRRKLTIPATQAYGSQRVGIIPPNSTLFFDIELKAIS